MVSRLSSILPFLLITLLCIFGVEMFYRGVDRFLFRPDSTTAAGRPTPTGAVDARSGKKGASAPPPATTDYKVIVSRNLFGLPPKEEPAQAKMSSEQLEQLKSTSLDVVLMGTVSGVKGDDRAIILTKKGRKQKLYQVGDVVEGAQIKSILRGKVILNFNGKDEILDMSEAAKFRKGGAARRYPNPSAAARVPNLPRVMRPRPTTGAGTVRRRPVTIRVLQPTRRLTPETGGGQPKSAQQ